MVDRPQARPDRRPLLERPELKPEERRRIGRALVPLLGWGLAASSLLAALAIWHLIRRGRVLRSNLGSPKTVSLPGIDERSRPRETPD